MAAKHWVGKATAVAQVWGASIDTVDGTPANNDFTVAIGNVSITVTGTTDAATTAAALVAGLNGSTHSYFSQITWANPSAGNITATADTAGVPFVCALSVSGAGTGSVTDFSETTANAGPNSWDSAANWSDAAVPTTNDTVVLRHTNARILWGLNQNSVTLTKLVIEKSFTGRIGLNSKVFTTDIDESTTLSTIQEYRQTYLKIKCADIQIGENPTGGSPIGSQRIKIDSSSTASEIMIFDSSKTSLDNGLPCIRLLSSASSNLHVRKAPGGVGIAIEIAGETSTFNEISITDPTTSDTFVDLGAGTTVSYWFQTGGTNTLRSAADVTRIFMLGGNLTTEGTGYEVELTLMKNGNLIANHDNPNGNGSRAWDSIMMDGGLLDGTKGHKTRYVGFLQVARGVRVRGNNDFKIAQFEKPDGNFEYSSNGGLREMNLNPVLDGSGLYQYSDAGEVLTTETFF